MSIKLLLDDYTGSTEGAWITGGGVDNFDDSEFLIKGTGITSGGGSVSFEVDFGDDDAAPLVNSTDGSTLEYTGDFCIEVLLKPGARIRAVPTGVSGATVKRI